MYQILTLLAVFFAKLVVEPAQQEMPLPVVVEDSSIYAHIQTLEAVKGANYEDDSLLAATSFELGKAYARLDHISLALQEFNFSLKYFREHSDSVGVSRALMAISETYSSVQEFDKALVYAVKSLGCTTDYRHHRDIYSRLGYLYFNLGRYDSAEKCLRIAATMFEQTGGSPVRPLITLGGVKLMDRNYEEALRVLLEVESLGLEEATITARYYVYNFISVLYHLKGMPDKSREYREKRNALDIPPEVVAGNLDFYETNFTADTLIGDFENAVRNQLKYIEMLKSMYKDDLESQLANYQQLYELYDKENAIKILEQENELYRLKQNESKFYLVILALGISLFFILTIAFYRSSHIRNRTNQELRALNQRIGLQAADLSRKNEQLEEVLHNLKYTQHHLIQSEKMASVGTFVSGMAHELNNPMNVLTGGLQMVEQSLSKIVSEAGYEEHELVQDTQLLLQQANGSITRVNRIIQALMMATQSQRAAVLDISEIIENVELTFRPYWPQEVQLQMNLQNVKVECYPGRIHHAIRAILENAVYYALHSSNEQKRVLVSLKSGADRAEISIRNNGPKIPQSDLLRVFDPFFTTREDESTGLGLYFAFSAVSDHQGVLMAANEDEEVAFTIYLPYSQSPGA